MAAPAGRVRVGGAWKKTKTMHIRVGGTWKKVKAAHVRVGGAWKKVYQNAYEIVVSANTQNFSARTAAIAAGWNQTDPVVVNVTINSGVYVGSSSAGSFSFDTGSLPVGSQVNVTNNGYIYAAGGFVANGYGNGSGQIGQSGGTAFRAQVPTTVTNNGTIAAGGGQGGGGQGGTWDYNGDGSTIYEYYGGNGGIGAGNYTASAGSGAQGGQCAAGLGAGYGGNGGALASAGAVGGGSFGWCAAAWSVTFGPGSAGAAGACTSGNANITWAATGTRYGALN